MSASPAAQEIAPFAVACRGLAKRFGEVRAVDGLDLEIRYGECFGLLGPNGAGKTTTIEILEGLTVPDAGDVRVLGRHWGTHERELRGRLGISLQETRFSEKLTVYETLDLFRSLYPRGRDPELLLADLALEEKRDARVGKLSGGQRQRLAVACALAGDPEILFLDEPTTGLDPQSRLQLWEKMETFRAAGRTVLLTTHYMEEAERLCDRVAVVDHGNVIALGSPVELIARLGGQHVVDFSLNGNGSPPTIEELERLPSVKTVRCDAGAFSLSVEEPHVALPALMNHLQATGREFATLTTRHATLEDVFVSLTGRHLSDADQQTKEGA